MGDHGLATATATALRLVPDLARSSLTALQADAPALPPREQLAAYAALAQHGEALAREPGFLEMCWNIADIAVGRDTELHQPAWATLKQLLPLLPRRGTQHKVAQRVCDALSRALRDSGSLGAEAAVRVADAWAAAVRELGSVLVGRGSNAIQPLLDLQKRLLEHAAPAVRVAAHRNWKVLTDSWFEAGDLAGPRRWKRLKLLLSPLVYRSSRKGVFRSRVLTEPDVSVRRAMVDSWLHLCTRVGEAAHDSADAAATLVGTESAEEGSSLHWEDALLPHLVRTDDEAIQMMLVEFAARLLGSDRPGPALPPQFRSAAVQDRILPGLCTVLVTTCDKWESGAGLSEALSHSLQLLVGALRSALASNTGAQSLLARLQRLCTTAPVQNQVAGHDGLALQCEQSGPPESWSTSDRSVKKRKIVRLEQQQPSEEQGSEEGSPQREQKENEKAQAVRVLLGPNYVRQASSSAAGCFFAARVNPPGEEAHWIHHAHVNASQSPGAKSNGIGIRTAADVDGDDDEATEPMSSPTGATTSPTRSTQHSCGDGNESKCVRNDASDSDPLANAVGSASLAEEHERKETLEFGARELSLTQAHSQKDDQQEQEIDTKIADWLYEGRQLLDRLESLQTLGAAGSIRAQAVRVAVAAVGALLPTT